MWMTISLVLALVHAVVSYRNGPPPSVCTSMTPGHYGTSPQQSTPKFVIRVSKDSYSPGEKITVTLSGCGGSSFLGFMLQARRADVGTDREAAIGTFDTPSGTKGLTCGADMASVTHATSAPKNSMIFTWTAPSSSAGHVVFRATFVESFTTYWVTLSSKPVRDNLVATAVMPGGYPYPTLSTCGMQSTTMMPMNRTLATTQPLGGLTTFMPMGFGIPKDEECGKSKGCLQNCYADYCRVLVSWQQLYSTNEVLIEMNFVVQGSDYVWMAIGLSADTNMGGDSVVECVMHSGSVRIYSSENKPYVKHNERVENVFQLRAIGGQISNGIFNCSFTIVNEGSFYAAKDNNFILLASGKTRQSSDDKRIHTETMMTVDKVNFMYQSIHHIGWASDSRRPSSGLLLMLAALVGTLLLRTF